jgi:hypothetical protein
MSSDNLIMRCERCNSEESFFRQDINHNLHVILSILTGGLWLVSYAAILIGHRFEPWFCSACEHSQIPPRQSSGHFIQKLGSRIHKRFQRLQA